MVAANLPFKIGDYVFDKQGSKGVVVDLRQLANNDPSDGQFLYKVDWESGNSSWMKDKEITKPSFWENLLKKFT